MRERLYDEQPSMIGGLNSVSDESALLPNQLRRTQNMRLTEFGGATKRGGTQRTSTSAITAFPIQNGFTFQQDSGVNQTLVVSNGTLYTTVYGAFPWTWTTQTGALSTSANPDFSQFRDGTGTDVVYIADDGLLNKWNGTALTVDIANTVNVSAIQVHNERLWGCGNATYPDSIFYSDLNNGDTLGNGAAGGGQIIVRTFSDEKVVGLASINTSLLIFHRRGISRLSGYGQDDITIAPAGLTADVGTIARGSIVASDNIAYFISERGLYRCNESEVAPIGTPNTPDPLLPLLKTLTASELDSIRAVINRATKELWISIPQYGCYQYHLTLGAWSGPWDSGYTNPATRCLFETVNATGFPVVLKGDASGWVSLCDAPNVNVDNAAADGTGGTRYPMTAQLHRMYAGDFSIAKALRWGYITASLRGSDQCRIEWSTGNSFGSFSLPASYDQTWGGVGTTWGTGTWGGAGSKNYSIPMGGTGYYIDISIVDSGEALPVFSRFKLETFILGRR